MNGAHAAAHLDDGDLIRYLDGEGSDTERREWARHVDACDRCARRAAAAESESRLFTGWLARADFEEELPDRAGAADGVLVLEPARPRARSARPSGWSPWLKAAAAIAVVAGPLAAIPPLRGWVVERVAPPAEEAAVTAADVPESIAHPVVRFVPEPGVFTVRVEGRGGSLAIGRADGDTAELRLSGESPDAVVAAASVRLRSLQPGTRHSLLVPGYVTGVRVLVGETLIMVEGADLDRGEVIPLD